MSLSRAETNSTTPQAAPMERRLIVPLDVPDARAADRLVEALGDAVQFYKIGYQFIFGGGVEYAKKLVNAGKQVFMDGKLNDIDHTIVGAVENIIKTGSTFVTLYGENGSAVRAAKALTRERGSKLRILVVTVLTSWDARDIPTHAPGDKTPHDAVMTKTRMAVQNGADGVIASGHEVAAIKAMFPSLIVVTPGIRSAGVTHHDQKRVVTPAEAIKAGADYLVVGRQISDSPDPRRAALEVIAEMRAAATA